MRHPQDGSQDLRPDSLRDGWWTKSPVSQDTANKSNNTYATASSRCSTRDDLPHGRTRIASALGVMMFSWNHCRYISSRLRFSRCSVSVVVLHLSLGNGELRLMLKGGGRTRRIAAWTRRMLLFGSFAGIRVETHQKHDNTHNTITKKVPKMLEC